MGWRNEISINSKGSEIQLSEREEKVIDGEEDWGRKFLKRMDCDERKLSLNLWGGKILDVVEMKMEVGREMRE